MKVFMLGWEFPPASSGGLGVACYGLAKALNGAGVDVLFVLPKPLAKNGEHRIPGGGVVQEVKQVEAPAPVAVLEQNAPADNSGSEAANEAPSVSANELEDAGDSASRKNFDAAGEGVGDKLQRVTFVPVDAWLEPYMSATQYQKMVVEEISGQHPAKRWEKRFDSGEKHWVEGAVIVPAGESAASNLGMEPHRVRDYLDEPQARKALMGEENTQYAGDLFAETERYARLALAIAKTEAFDVIHAHDWMTFEAATAVAAESGKSLVVQIHSTELDRAGFSADERILEAERAGMNAATKIIAVSYKTKTQLVEKYGIDAGKIQVVYNAVEPPAQVETVKNGTPKKHKTVLFLGRMTQQKGPDYFLRAAKKLLSVEPDVKFIMAGKGDMVEELKELSEELGIHRRVVFTGFLKKSETERAYRSADVYVMPSVSEPFGIAPLEALSHDVPVIISKQSGVAEILRHVLKVDFWDTEDLANKILAVLRHPPLAATLRREGQGEVRQLSWDDSAEQIVELYKVLTGVVAAMAEETD